MISPRELLSDQSSLNFELTLLLPEHSKMALGSGKETSSTPTAASSGSATQWKESKAQALKTPPS